MNITTSPVQPRRARCHRAVTRTLVLGTATLAALLVTTPSQAYEPRPPRDAVEQPLLSAYATPLAALGGMTPAQYLADHEAHILASRF